MADAEGADDDEGDGAGDTIEDLFAAVEHGRIDDVARLLLLDHRISINRADNDGVSPLFVACANGRVEVARLLIEHGADVDQAMDTGWTPLLMACAKGHVDVVRLLIEQDADVGQASNDGTSPLSAACRKATSTSRDCSSRVTPTSAR